MASDSNPLNQLGDAFTEPDPGYREMLIREVWAVDGVFAVEGLGEGRGANALSALIGRLMSGDWHYWLRTHHVQEAGGAYSCRWTISRLEGDAIELTVSAEVDDGKITLLTARNYTPKPNIGARALNLLREHPIPALGVALAALYVLLRVPVTFFYNDLGVTPEEVGYSDAILLRNSLLLLTAIVILALVGVALTWAYRPVQLLSRVLPRLRRHRGLKVAWIAGLLTFGPPVILAAVGYASFFIVDDLEPYGLWGLAAILLPVLAGATMRFYGPAAAQYPFERERRRREPARLGPAFAVTLIYGLAYGVGFVATLYAISAATEVRDGNDAGGRFFPWRAIPAEVAFLSPSSAQPAGAFTMDDCDKLRFLGEADGRSVFFDTKEDQAIRLPSADVIVALDRNCELTADRPPCTVEGTSEDDHLQGTSNDDVMCGAGGNDRIRGRDGNDLIYGGTGHDQMHGGTGSDEGFGEEGRDKLGSIDGEDGNDSVDGGTGTDACRVDREDFVTNCP